MDVDRQLSGGEPSRHEQADALLQPSSDEDTDAEDPSNNKAGRSQGSNIHPQPNPESSSVAQFVATPYGQTASVRALATIPPDSWKLFEIYFTNVHSWLPICEKHDTLKSAYSYPLQDLPIDSDQADSGSHAELWSVLAVASLYDAGARYGESSDTSSARPTKLYETAKSMIPSESGRFDIGHIRALLNLVVFNMSRMLTGAAWLLVGCASRLLESVNQQALVNNSRHKHVYYGCFLLDGMLALQLKRRPHFRKSDLEHLGSIDEDGLEEWQPWSGFDDPSHEGRMTPLLSLSTFNNVIELVDLLVNVQQPPVRRLYTEDAMQRLERWRASLPAKLGPLWSGNAFAFITPPAVLLQATYHCASFASNPSDSSLQRLLNILEQCQMGLGIQRLPVPLQSLIITTSRLASHVHLHDATQTQLRRVWTGMAAAWPQLNDQDIPQTLESTTMPIRHSTAGMPLPNQQNSEPFQMVPGARSIPQPTAPLNSLFSGSHSTNASLLAVSSPSHTDPRHPEPTSDLESFFDELASLDSATRPDNQPQFMQNLGFGPEASMADLFSEYIPMQSSSFLTREDAQPTGFDQYAFYDAS
ncbi:quinic acid utilization activator [Stemphylium lycopersici]|uniref:Quinic acid utilization activator n=1 Tax=Stemphylium lycopersici TaxID=183478 RepID=A0A364MYN5_STELY|nr:quinic acid utilization activator [Stemphylium lycopersici]RAR07415.1 quinic acid utilization activator [Stemphylium lycopersici]